MMHSSEGILFLNWGAGDGKCTVTPVFLKGLKYCSACGKEIIKASIYPFSCLEKESCL